MRRLLGVNIDHVATLREARGTLYPSVLEAAKLAVNGGANQITVHLREDRRHIQERDLWDLKKTLTVPLNLEMSLAPEVVAIALGVLPKTATIVPEKRAELTTEGGLDCIANRNALLPVITALKKNGIEVSLFIDPEMDQIAMARELRADAVELHTGRYCSATTATDINAELIKLKKAASYSIELGFKLCAGHGLNYDNTAAVVKEIPEIIEYNIGHAVVARALAVGMQKAVCEMRSIIC